MIEFIESRNIWVYKVNDKIVKRSISKEKLEQMVAKEFGVVTSGTVVFETPKSEFTVKERFEFVEEFTKLVAKGIIPSLVVTGSGGLGKSHTVTESLKAIGKKEDTIGSVDGDFLVIKGYTTPRGMYETLYDNNGKIIIYDDADDAFKDPIGANILKAALDSGDTRVISWGASSAKDDPYPSRFEFTGKVIFISNLSISKFPQAILSRSMLADVTLNTEEKIERIEQVFSGDKNKRFSNDDKNEVIEFIRENASKFKDLNIRSAYNALKMKLALGDNWKRMALYSATLN